MPRILEPTVDHIARAAEALRQRQPVAFPTETVYGLGAPLFDSRAIDRVFTLKGRPRDNPMIAHVLGSKQAREHTVLHWSDAAAALAAEFWPGPLTMVLEKKPEVPVTATAGRNTIAVRAPSHPVARELLEAFGEPIAAPSANRSGRVSPTTAEHVASDFEDVADLIILDGGPCTVGIESTVLDLTTTPPRVLRPGSITVDQLRSVVGEITTTRIRTQDAAPGTRERHYAPRTPLRIVDRDAIARRLEKHEPVVAIIFGPELPSPPGEHTVLVLPAEPITCAHELYDTVRRADACDATAILIERPPRDRTWDAVNDRISRMTNAPAVMRGHAP